MGCESVKSIFKRKVLAENGLGGDMAKSTTSPFLSVCREFYSTPACAILDSEMIRREHDDG